MESEEEDIFNDEEDGLSEGFDDDDDFLVGDDVESSEPAAKRPYDDDFQYECLTPESIVMVMTKSIDDVNNVFQVGFGKIRSFLFRA